MLPSPLTPSHNFRLQNQHAQLARASSPGMKGSAVGGRLPAKGPGNQMGSAAPRARRDCAGCELRISSAEMAELAILHLTLVQKSRLTHVPVKHVFAVETDCACIVCTQNNTEDQKL